MKEVNINFGMSDPYVGGFSILEKTDNSSFKPLLLFTTCRSYMCDTLFSAKNKKYKHKPPYPFVIDYKKGNIYIAIGVDERGKEHFMNNIPKLHEIEKKAGVQRSVVYTTQNNKVLVIKGSSHWKQSCWKMMLYTFYLKTFCYAYPKTIDLYYWHALSNGNEEILLSKIKIKREIFSYEVYYKQMTGRHDKEGFVSICTGKNPPMAKLLGVNVIKPEW